MFSASLDLEKDYSLCFDEQFTVKPIQTKLGGQGNLNDQSSSILTSICLDSDCSNTNEMTESLENVVTPATNSIPYDASLMESEMFFQENEPAPEPSSDFNFTKISKLLVDPEIVREKKTTVFSHSNQTLDELSTNKCNNTYNNTVQDLTINSSKAPAEVETVKHKLTSLWNNVKYGWVSYLKKPNKMSLDNGPIFILGKKFNTNNQYERSSSDSTHLNSKPCDMYESFIDANKFISLNESYICPSRPNQEANEFVLASSPPLSTSPFAVTRAVDNTNGNGHTSSSGNNTTTNNKAATAAYMADYLQLQYLSLQKTSLEQEIHSRLWFTYRRDFEPLNGNLKYSSDCGWGCMLRSAQMLIGQGLLSHHFGKNWSLYNKFTRSEYNMYKEILALFNDRPSRSCPFGLHRLLQVADKKLIGNGNHEFVNGSSSNASSTKSTESNQENVSRVGSWFGPTSVCLLVKEALAEAPPEHPILNQIGIYVAQDCMIYKQDVIDMCTVNVSNTTTNNNNAGVGSSPLKWTMTTSTFRPCIILVSVRLGGDELNEIYIPSLKMFLEMEMCIGVIGGKPKHSLYFFGYQGDKIIYLDPHFCQATQKIYSTSDHSIQSTSSHSSLSSSKHSYDDTNMSDYEIFDNSTFHCENPSKISFAKLDPSLAIGFLCSSLDELEKLCSVAKNMSSLDNVFPLFGVNDDSFEKSQLKYQLLCDEEVLADSLTNTSPTSQKKIQCSPAIPIKGRRHEAASKSSSSSSSSKGYSFIQSLPRKFGSSPNSKKSFLAEKFTRSKQQKKKSESEDFVLI